MSNQKLESSNGFIETYTCGGLLIPGGTAPLSFRLYISNLSPGVESAGFKINRITDGAKTPLISGSVAVPSSGAASIVFNPAGLGLSGKTIETVVTLPLVEPPGVFSLHPSLNLLQGGENGVLLPLIIATTADFALVKEEQAAAPAGQPEHSRLSDIPSNLLALTWGLFDIPEAEPGIQTGVTLWLGSLSNQAEAALVTVNSVAPGTTSKKQVLVKQVTVPAGQAQAVQVTGVAGLAMEAIVEIPFAAPPLTVLPLLTPSITINRRRLATGAVETVRFLSPGQALFADR